MRLFAAVDLSSDVKDYLFELSSSMKNTKVAKVNWVAKKNLHITLKFFGEVNNEDLDKLKNSLSKIKYTSFYTNLSDVGVCKSNLKISVVWVGLDQENKFVDLQKLIDAETIDFGNIKLGAHITLGRVKFLKNKKAFLKNISNTRIKSLKFNVDSFLLFKSILGKDGPKYEVLEEYKLI